MKIQSREVGTLIVAVAIPLVVGAIGGFATASSVSTWYQELTKPAWNPPDWVFGPVWTVLYILMGVAVWFIWRLDRDSPAVRVALVLYGAQLFLNLFWSIIFFGLRNIGLALVEIVVLVALILATLVVFFRLKPVAGYLLIPYQAWVIFATGLNASIWWLNR